MATFELAKKLGLIETLSVQTNLIKNISLQNFDYLIVIDFESTCWDAKDTNKRPPEIIEFSAVLFSIRLNNILNHFQQYVMPLEVPKLTEFCINFTGITQQQVDKGVPLGTCLMLFMKWIKEQSDSFNLSFPGAVSSHSKKAVLVTWSDWDLKICLKNECKRKRIIKADLFNAWIDLKALYMEHYSRRPKGLNGALTEVGMKFIGKEHCGLDDARNTALLAGKMINDGILLRITKDLSQI
ncbi:hypothetical protein RN001_006426 [Aquatica leii]|uniref:Exonuclease domain-containing protein n=1 Tax=Aquatica leii TaxID=1421715 RepID=A0AAN7PDH9_9COLE|nr:hypothetical protein RN001_006426 [Aquatica leii]